MGILLFIGLYLTAGFITAAFIARWFEMDGGIDAEDWWMATLFGVVLWWLIAPIGLAVLGTKAVYKRLFEREKVSK